MTDYGSSAWEVQVESGISCVRKQVSASRLIGPNQKDTEAFWKDSYWTNLGQFEHQKEY